jgi:uncharacterized protein YjbI with pentapeptide repeats
MSKKEKPQPGRRHGPDLALRDEVAVSNADVVLEGNPLEDACLRDAEFAGKKLASFRASRSHIVQVSFTGVEAGSFRVRDTRFEKCDFANAVLRGMRAERVDFIDRRLVGFRAIECSWQDVLLQSCDLRYCQLTDGKLQHCEFKSSHMADADFRRADLECALFSDVVLHRADVTGGGLNGTDLRGTDIEDLIAAASDLYGAIVSPAQATGLARLLNIDIRWKCRNS